MNQPVRHNSNPNTTGCLLYYNYFKNCYKVIAIDLSKQLVVDADPKAIKLINFTGNLAQQATTFFIIKENSSRFFTEKCQSILILFFSLI